MTADRLYVVCTYCWKRGTRGVPAATTVVTASGMNPVCQPCADELSDAMAAAWDVEAARAEA